MKEEKKDIWAFTLRLFGIARDTKKEITLSTIASVVGNVSQMSLMGFGVCMIMCSGGLIEGNAFVYGFLTFLSAFLIIACRYLEGMISHIGAYRLLADLRVSIFQDICRLSPARLLDRKAGDLLSVAISDIETLEFFFAHAIGPVFTVILLPMITLILAARCGSLYVWCLLPIYIIVSVVLPVISLKTGQRIGKEYRKDMAEYQSLMLESVYGIRDIQIFDYAKRRSDILEGQNKKINRTQHIKTLHGQLVTSAPTFFIYLGRIIIIAVAAIMAREGKYDAPSIVLLSYVVSASFSSTQSLTAVISNLIETYAAAGRLFVLQDAEAEVQDAPDAVALTEVGDITFEHVNFAYAPELPVILQDANLSIKKGEIVGIKGESGIGKSTVARLLLRFYNPISGSIRLGGEKIERFTLQSVHERIALLEQDTFLFHTTVAANIAFGRPDASREEIMRAAKMAGIHDLIMTLPDGYDTDLGEMNDRLSGGERQRVGIARTLLMDPDVLMLDEPTSALDVFNEKSFLKTLKEAFGGKTIIIISHRSSTLAICDSIYTLENGTFFKA